VLIGTPQTARGIGRLLGGGDVAERSLLGRLLRELPGVDIRIVADPTLRRGRAAELAPAVDAGTEVARGAEAAGSADGDVNERAARRDEPSRG
jgi:hypothetical protein